MDNTVARMTTIDLNLLGLFSIVAETASFSEAARKLRVPRSSVSRNVAELESALGVQLFNRTTRKVALTTAGAALHARLAPQLAALQESLGSLPERDEIPSGLLRFSTSPDFGVTVLPEVLAGFAVRYPAVRLEVRLASRFVDLVAEGFDFALRIKAGRLADSSLVARRLSPLGVGLYASPAYLAGRPPIRSPGDTAGHEWISFRGEPLPAPLATPSRPARLVTDDMMLVHQAARSGMGIAFVPTFLARSDLTAGALVRLLPRFTPRTGALFFVHPPARKLPSKMVAFRDYLIEYIEANPLCSAGG
jgi:DNA-binding transcriptional LysR family regulator